MTHTHDTHETPAIVIDGERLLTIEQAAAEAGCSGATILRRLRRGELAGRRVLGRRFVRCTATPAR